MEKEMSEEPRRKWERCSPALKQRALARMKRGENVRALSQELGRSRSLLYWWKQQAEGRVRPKEPGLAEDPQKRRIQELQKKVTELEGVIGQKTLELDFFAGALRRIEASRQKRSSSGGRASIPRSEGGCSRKAD
jgi:transposase-like protein